MRDRTREKLWKKYSMYEILEDSNGEKPRGLGRASIDSIMRVSNIKIKRKDEHTVFFEREGYNLMCYLDVPNKKIPILVSHLYAASDVPQDCIDGVLEEFRVGLRVIYAERNQKSWEAVLKDRGEREKRTAKYYKKHPDRTRDLILD